MPNVWIVWICTGWWRRHSPPLCRAGTEERVCFHSAGGGIRPHPLELQTLHTHTWSSENWVPTVSIMQLSIVLAMSCQGLYSWLVDCGFHSLPFLTRVPIPYPGIPSYSSVQNSTQPPAIFSTFLWNDHINVWPFWPASKNWLCHCMSVENLKATQIRQCVAIGDGHLKIILNSILVLPNLPT